MVFSIITTLAAFVFGLALLIFCGDKAVKHSINIALALKVSPLVIGLTLVSLGTDFPEIINSIVSCAVGHGDINLGGSIGSVLSQITLIFGFFPFIAGSFEVRRKDIVVIGTCLILSLLLMLLVISSGYISGWGAFILVISWPLFMLLMKKMKITSIEEELTVEEELTSVTKLFDNLFVAIFGFIGVAIGSYIVVNSIVELSSFFNLPEFIISFFALAIGTSLPELTVDFTALRKKQYNLAIGDIMGSSIIDATLSLGIGLLLFPTAVSGGIGMVTGLYTLFVSLIVVLILGIRKKVDKITGILFIFLYLLSYAIMI